MTRDRDDDLDALRRMLPVPAERDFPAGRSHQREEHLMTSWSHPTGRPHGPRRFAVRLATSVAVAAAVTGAVLTLHSSPAATPQASGPTTRTTAPATVTPAELPAHISTVAYSLDRGANGIVKVTVHSTPGHTPDAAQLKKDLARMGIQAQVFTKRPHCFPQIYNLAVRQANGDFAAEVVPDLLPKYPETILFALGGDGRGLTLSLGSGPTPTCAPMPATHS